MISDEYRRMLELMHQKRPSFGNRSGLAPEIAECIEQYGVTSILDFGCGKGFVPDIIRQRYPDIEAWGYDPGQPEWSVMPQSVDMIYSSDVLEHVEPCEIDATLRDLASRCRKVQWHLIACHPAKKGLPDGRNAHLIVEPPAWWREKIRAVLNWRIVHEEVRQVQGKTRRGPGLVVEKYIVKLEP